MACKYINSTIKLLSRAQYISQASKNSLGSCRYSNYKASNDVSVFKPTVTDFEVSKAEWQFVERLLPPLTVPKPSLQDATLWKPPTAKPNEQKYFINRNRNYLLPVYLTSTHRGMRKITEVRKIHGDINELNKDLVKFVEKSSGKVVASQVNELVGCISFKDDYVKIIQQYLLVKGF